ncbi:MAG: rRNA maturation RNase YbeY [Candidatus Eisenbacteria bacterium]
MINHGLDLERAPAGDGLGLVLAGDTLVRRLNREFRGKDTTTDVLSFSNGPEPLDPDEPRLLGEVIISVPQCLRQAREQAVPPGQELVRLVVHGLLHVLGHDHIEPKDRAVMVPKERRLRDWARRHGIGPRMLGARAAR